VSLPPTSLQLQSRVTSDARLHLDLATVAIAPPADDEVVIRVEAAPINPSDIGAMIGPADVSRIRVEEDSGDAVRVSMPVPTQAMPELAAKVGQLAAAGIEGAGVVVAAGSSPRAQSLMGRVVATNTGAMYTQYRVAKAADLLVAEDGATPAEAASSFINPLTVLGMLETMRREGHHGLVHTAAASNLGQMLTRLCLADGVPLVTIVRTGAQAELLRGIGAPHVVDSSTATFPEDLTAAIAATDATLCFDVIGGGELASRVLTSMEAVQAGKMTGHHRYGSSVHKQVYICGLLDAAPTRLTHTYGLAWGVGGWLLDNFLTRIGAEAAGRLKDRVAGELTTTFASRYARTISLREALDPAVITAYHRRATGQKYLIAPHS
jgi:NADPH2:quinone reductase